MRVAIVDCGTNTVRLLVADVVAGHLTEVTRRLSFVRLGQGVDATGRFAPEALIRLFATVGDYARVCADLGAEKVRFVATAAARDVSNREEFMAGVRTRMGVEPEVISGDEEAQLSFNGALSGGRLAEGTVLVVDIGGGSTELIRGGTDGRVTAQVSLNVGSARLRERFFTTIPPQQDEIEAARRWVAAELDRSPVPLGGVDHWIGVAGTMTSLSAMNQGLTTYDRDKVHNSVMSVADLSALSYRLLGLSANEAISAYPSLEPQRAEVIGAGALIASEVARRVNQPVRVRESDILDAAAAALAGEGAIDSRATTMTTS